MLSWNFTAVKVEWPCTKCQLSQLSESFPGPVNSEPWEKQSLSLVSTGTASTAPHTEGCECSSHKPDTNDLKEFKQIVVKKIKRMPILHSRFALWMACFKKQTCFISNIQKVYLISSIKTGMKILWSLTGLIHTVDSHYSWQLCCITSPWTLK